MTVRGFGEGIVLMVVWLRKEGVARRVVPVDIMLEGSLERGERLEMVPVVGAEDVWVRKGAG